MQKRTNRRKLTLRVGLSYFFMNVVSISLFTYVITSNQASLISDITRYQAKDVMSLLVQNLRNLPEMQGKIVDKSLRLNAIDSTFHRLAPQYAIFMNDSILRASSPAVVLQPDHRKASEKALFLKEFSGMDYFLQMDQKNDLLLFYVSLSEFGFPGISSVTQIKIKEISQRFQSMYQLIGFTVVALTLLHLLFAFFIFRLVIRPILRLSEATQKIALGEYDTQVVAGDQDEIGALADGFNQMTETIRNTIGQLNAKVILVNEAKDKMEQMANVDELMQIFNRRHVLSQMERLVSTSQRYKNPLSVILVDIDHFKQVNDKYGHLTGDEVLREVASRLKHLNRETDILARYGGEELLLLLPQTLLNAATNVAEKLRRAIEEKSVLLSDGQSISVTVSVGVAEFTEIQEQDPERKVTVEHLIELADIALYQAKKQGRNRVCVMPTKGSA